MKLSVKQSDSYRNKIRATWHKYKRHYLHSGNQLEYPAHAAYNQAFSKPYSLQIAQFRSK